MYGVTARSFCKNRRKLEYSVLEENDELMLWNLRTLSALASSICPNYVDKEQDAEYILPCCRSFRYPGETSLGSNQLMEEMLICEVLGSQNNLRMAEIMLELRRLEEWRRNFT